MANDLKLKGPVREIGIERDHDRHDSFNITIGITIKTEGKVTYEEAERLSTKFRREYLGKDVEFRAIHIPCPHCDKILNSETGLKQHILKVHPEKAELLTPKVAATKMNEPKKKGKVRKAEKPEKKTKKRRASKKIKPAKPKTVVVSVVPATKKASIKIETPVLEKTKLKKGQPQPTPILRESASKSPQKTKQLTLY